MTQSRREFIVGALKAAGIGGLGWEAFKVLYGLGGEKLVAEASMESHFISGHLNAGGGSGWATWDEASESGIADDNTFVCFFENFTANGNETGQGLGLSGADLVYTCNGAVPGAIGSPPTRQMDNDGTDYFTAPAGMLNAALAAGTSWTWIMKCTGVGTPSNTNYDLLYLVDSGAPQNYFILGHSGASNLFYVQVQGGGTTVFAGVATTDPHSTSGIVYFCVWADGTYVRAGFIDSGSPGGCVKPTKWSDFNVNDRLSYTGSVSFAARWTGGVYSFGYPLNRGPVASAYYVLFSKTCLIDNAS